MKFVVCARTTDDSDSLETIEKELSLPLDSLKEAERWIEESYRDHPELLERQRLIPNREMEISIKSVE